MLSRIITGDESWVHHYEPETKRASMQWKHPTSPAHKKFKVTPMAGIAKAYCSPNSSNVTTPLCMLRNARSWQNFILPFARSGQASSLKGCCCCITMPVLIVPIRPQRGWGHSSRKSSKIHLTAQTSPQATSTCLALKNNIFQGNAFLRMTRLKEQCARSSDSNHKNFMTQVSRDLWNGGTSV